VVDTLLAIQNNHAHFGRVKNDNQCQVVM